MEFGAFVRLGPGVEGLVHISELSHKRVFRVSDVLQEGQEVEVLVLSVDPEQQRISLSLKALEAEPRFRTRNRPSQRLAEPETPPPAPRSVRCPCAAASAARPGRAVWAEVVSGPRRVALACRQ